MKQKGMSPTINLYISNICSNPCNNKVQGRSKQQLSLVQSGRRVTGAPSRRGSPQNLASSRRLLEKGDALVGREGYLVLPKVGSLHQLGDRARDCAIQVR